jgi:hypothetical protein
MTMDSKAAVPADSWFKGSEEMEVIIVYVVHIVPNGTLRQHCEVVM